MYVYFSGRGGQCGEGVRFGAETLLINSGRRRKQTHLPMILTFLVVSSPLTPIGPRTETLFLIDLPRVTDPLTARQVPVDAIFEEHPRASWLESIWMRDEPLLSLRALWEVMSMLPVTSLTKDDVV